ncbi:MAG: sigma 54-interacting transcriptional regulator [Halioglobus sp.]
MTSNSDVDLTLPSVVANLVTGRPVSSLLLSIAFHPETDRIGESIMLPLDRGTNQWHLGRGTPLFSRQSKAESNILPRALDDMYISRKTLQLDYSDGTVVLCRESTACRCQVDGTELENRLILSSESLNAGVSLFLANRILLVLRELSTEDFSELAGEIATTLRGSGPYISSLKRQIQRAAASDVDVLIRGETGTGKELVASAIHANSHRADSDMISVNMSAIPVALAPSALFGSAKGSFTGASGKSAGYFEQAENGVLFLDEIGDTPLEVQAQLLRVLQQREIQPVGGAIKKIDCRVIAATDAPIDEGSDFKTALRHRLAGCEIVLRPLREHPEDVGELLWFFIRNYLSETTTEITLPDPESDRLEVAAWAEMFHVFVRYGWPGNVRQLANFARQVSLASESALVFPPHLRRELTAALESDGEIYIDSDLDPELEEGIAEQPGTVNRSEDIDDQSFLAAMATARYEPKAAANILGISRTAVYRRIDESQQLRKAAEIPQDEVQRTFDACGGDLSKTALSLRVSRVGLRSRVSSLNAPKQ